MLKQDIIHYEFSILKSINNMITSIENKLKGNHAIIKISNPFKSIRSLSNDFGQCKKILKKNIKAKIIYNQDYLMDQNMRQSLLLKKIISLFETYINTVDKNYKDIKRIVKIKMKYNIDILNSKKQQVKQMNPTLLLNKGYAIVRNNNNDIIKSIRDIPSKSELNIQVSDGTVKVNRKE